MPELHSSDMRHTVNDVSALSGISSLSKLCIPFPNYLLNGDLCRNFFDFHISSFFLVFNHDFVIYIDFTHVAASNTATDDV